MSSLIKGARGNLASAAARQGYNTVRYANGNLSKREYVSESRKTGGALAGSVIGAELGSLILPGAGTLVGGLLGGVLGGFLAD